MKSGDHPIAIRKIEETNIGFLFFSFLFSPENNYLTIDTLTDYDIYKEKH